MSVAGVISRICNAACDPLAAPFRAWSHWWALSVFSLVIAVIALLAFKFFSNQQGLARARGRMLARVLELRLYKDDLPGIFGAFGRVLGAMSGYLAAYVKPLLVLIIPVSLILIQMSCWFDHRPFRAGETGLLTITFAKDADIMMQDAAVTASGTVALETDALRIPAERQMVWRFRATGGGPARLDISVDDEQVCMDVLCGGGLKKIAAARAAPSFWSTLAHPAAPPLPADSLVERIELRYPAGPSWLLPSFVLMIVFGLLLKPFLRVEL